MYTQREQCGGGGEGGRFVRPSTESIGRNNNKKVTIESVEKVQSHGGEARRLLLKDPTVCPQGRAVFPSLLSLSLFVLLPSLIV